MLSPSVRTWSSRVALALAAAASLATSAPQWSLSNDATGPRARLTASEPEATFHVTVSSSHRHEVTAAARLAWFPGTPSPGSSVRWSIVPDDGSAGSTDTADAARSDFDLDVFAGSECSRSCRRGYVLQVERVGGSDDDFVDVSWVVSATTGGDEASAPRGAFVEVVVD